MEQRIMGQMSGFSTFRISVIFALSRKTPVTGEGIAGIPAVGLGVGTEAGTGTAVEVGGFTATGGARGAEDCFFV
jgi:hypothetical protein